MLPCLFLSALNWPRALLGAVTAAWPQEPDHVLLAPPELDFRRSLVISHDAALTQAEMAVFVLVLEHLLHALHLLICSLL